MKYKVNNKYIVDAKSHVEAVKAVKKVEDSKCKDANITPDELRRFCIKHNYYTTGNVADYIELLSNAGKWDLREIASDIAQHSNGIWATEVYSKLRETFGDSVKDADKIPISKMEEIANECDGVYTRKNMDGAHFKFKSERDAYEFFDILRRYHSGIHPDVSFNNVALVRNSYIDFYDSIKDNNDIDYLSKEEEQAIDDYKKAISNTKDPKLLKIFGHILKEEVEHLEELQNEELEDSCKDADIQHYQEWVDYDMKKYGHISEKTRKEIEEAGYSILKDKYGDYEVIAKD